ncbi:PilZ domain protein [bacterium BMS3Bbin06]|nr:PilZ domain protein [bacterium BMS3Abin08]GBE35748.1 PilZ domain protein [bacterium BMS3Bbin06]HDO35875.1 PilZ domain-containing protein [Nitrospirota bacterium]HDY72077.1 PilZ domain-containing protein [Nitrospirota bacterium]
MERRGSGRTTVSLRAERISGNTKRAVLIENISETGIHMITAPAKTAAKFKTGMEINLKFRLSSGETLNLRCKVRWAYAETPPDGLTDSVGLQIIDPPLRYREFVRTMR